MSSYRGDGCFCKALYRPTINSNHVVTETTCMMKIQPRLLSYRFDEYPLTEAEFFKLGMKFMLQNQGIIFTHGGVAVLTLGLTKPTSLIFKLKYGEQCQETLNDVSLKR